MDTKLRLAGIVKESIVDGPGIRLVLFAQGCPHNCPGCHNPQTHSYDGGMILDIEDILDMIRKNPLLDGITLSGGEPFEQAGAFAKLAEKTKQIGLNILTYTGYTFEQILNDCINNPGWKHLLETTDILVDGRFDISQKDMLLKFRGSKNQRVIDVRRSVEKGSIINIEWL